MSRKTLLPIVAVAVALGFACPGAVSAIDELPGQGVTVQPARATWTTGFFLEALYSRGLEELGYTVKDPKKLSNPIFYMSVYEGDVDFWANGWFPIHYAQMPKDFEKRGSLVGHIVRGGAVQGYLVSKKHVEQFNIKTLDDFKRPEVKKAFDANGDGKADMVGCPPGWGCEKTIAHHMDVYDMDKHINVIKAAYEAGMADAVARYNAGEPIFFYTWTPNWTVFKLKPGEDVMWIGVSKLIPSEAQEGQQDALIATGIKGAVSDPLKMGWIASSIRVVANNQFLADNPAAEKLFELMSVPMEDIAVQNNRMFAGENTESDIERHVTEWIAVNQDKWGRWLEEARRAFR